MRPAIAKIKISEFSAKNNVCPEILRGCYKAVIGVFRVAIEGFLGC